MSDIKKYVLISCCAACIIVGLLLCSPAIHTVINGINYANHKVDEATNYELRKEVEDTARSMIASYTSDKLIYEQYKGSTSREKMMWCEAAKQRANQTAANYNEYMRKNSFVWSDNIPADIDEKLEYIQ